MSSSSGRPSISGEGEGENDNWLKLVLSVFGRTFNAESRAWNRWRAEVFVKNYMIVNRMRFVFSPIDQIQRCTAFSGLMVPLLRICAKSFHWLL